MSLFREIKEFIAPKKVKSCEILPKVGNPQSPASSSGQDAAKKNEKSPKASSNASNAGAIPKIETKPPMPSTSRPRTPENNAPGTTPVSHLPPSTKPKILVDKSQALQAVDGPTRGSIKPYGLATHCVRVRRSGTILDINSLWDIEHSGLYKESYPESDTNRMKSVENFSIKSEYNEMLNGLKYFERYYPRGLKGNTMPKLCFDWGEVDRNCLANCLVRLCHQAKKIFMAEPRLIELSSPVYVLGDIHGNYPDLVTFEKAFWKLGMLLTPASFLFLGDFVDRGLYSVEVIAYLLAHKISAPNKLVLLRGNHEIREVQKMFSFYSECLTKFGQVVGTNVWNAVNEVFDCMPFAAIIDKQIFCAHGGIVPPWIGNGMISKINEIPVPLSKPEEVSVLAWELMWSDPIHVEEMTEEELDLFKIIEGFGKNVKRGTGHVYSQTALDSFLERNRISHVIRAHEVQQAGFKVQLGGKLLTVFSSSRYCGGSNEAACILVDKAKLRTIRIDTGNELI